MNIPSRLTEGRGGGFCLLFRRKKGKDRGAAPAHVGSQSTKFQKAVTQRDGGRTGRQNNRLKGVVDEGCQFLYMPLYEGGIHTLGVTAVRYAAVKAVVIGIGSGKGGGSASCYRL